MDDLSSFENYCIVCDRLIATQREPEPQLADRPKKKTHGAIRVKNPDGSTTIRTANGVKTTRPAVRRPSTESKPTESKPTEVKPEPKPASVTSNAPPPYVSNIYCSRKCAEQDAGASGPAAYENMARVFGLGITSSSDAVMVPGHIDTLIASPPSPLLGSDTDTSSATSLAARSSPASVPKTFGFFRIPRDGPDDAWKDLGRQRRSSLAHSRLAPFEPVIVSTQMARQRSNNSSGRPQSTISGCSTDSLSSLWQSEGEVNRTPSSGGGIRGMTPIGGDALPPPTRRSSSDGPTSAPRPLIPRAAMSHTSLGALPSPSLAAFSAEVGSAPNQTAFLIHSYASAFPARDGSPMLKPVPGFQTPDLRSCSVSNVPAVRAARPRTGSVATASWDAFGKAEVRERTRRNNTSVDLVGSISREPSSLELNFWRERAGSIGRDATPKQSLEDGCWQIRYTRSSTRSGHGSRSRSASREPRTAPVPEDEMSNATSIARPIPTRARTPSAAMASSNSTARSRTPQSRLATSVTRRSSAVDAMASLRIGSPCLPVLSPENASPSSRSIPRAGFDWNESSHRTYELPAGVVVNPNKGLFYFKA